jgi:hypothetical protein
MYRVTYSRRVLDELESLILRNPTQASSIGAAAIEIDRRLHIYPQFGQPLRNLSARPAQLWIATLPPLILQYVLLEYDDDKKAETGLDGEVMIVRPFKPFAKSGIT